MLNLLLHHHWWSWLAMAAGAGYFTFIFDMFKQVGKVDDSYAEDDEDKFKG